ncbi:CHC2 zinc finger domain-containing protein [Leptospira noguchii]|uniref:CHC2 zinc finger domain-containing protein n=1 Tax=Leptospira noguchii TaxID=28182 RepID=UPI0011477911|nr:CHC2 zinc finger domain-containing protein [Leptospira noguchii]TQE70263.1 toprim domain-containing protein [Leptospira noguchii]UOG54984.1 CHC2 zinc finger domain-containing protein [Leptospira noguchii]UOG55000.1 CHC2 zinc finger domain-containing protein [Leptospira noguchii]UOG55016.1 CHC2 zinc finger domain-containing protein [Leptospira noguchii]
MPEYIPKEEIARLKEETDLIALVRSYGIELKSHGVNWLGRCPFHEDRTPSFVVTPAKNLWHCMGACKTGGSAIDFVMKREDLGFNEAVEILRKFKLRPERSKPVTLERVLGRKIPTTEKLSSEERAVVFQVLEYYATTLRQTRSALSYLQTRKIGSEESISKFRIGYSDGSLGKILPSRQSIVGQRTRDVLKEFGIFGETGQEYFQKKIVIPIFTQEKELCGMYGRRVLTSKDPRIPNHRYLPGRHLGIWNEEDAFTKKELVLCESIIDALTFWENGIRNVTCSYGVEGFTEIIQERILETGIQKIYIAYDADMAGDKGAASVYQKLKDKGITIFRVLLPLGMDVNEIAVRNEEVQDTLFGLLEESVILTQEELMPQYKEMFSVETNLSTTRPQEPLLTSQELTALVESQPQPEVKITKEEVEVNFPERTYLAKGLFRNYPSLETLKVTLKVAQGDRYHVDNVDLLSYKGRTSYISTASNELKEKEETIKREIGRLINVLEDALNAREKERNVKTEVELSPEERAQAIQYLEDPKLLTNILMDFERCGLVGERVNSLVGYLASITRRTENPLAIIIQSSSSAGKSTLMDSILDFVPEEEKEKYSAMTGQSLFYMSSTNLKNKVLAISEEEGVERAKYALKILQSEKKISIASAMKDPTTGRTVTEEYSVEGPVVIFLTTTNLEIDEELENRCLILTVNEGREQTRTILEIQREQETLEGIVKKRDKEKILTLHKNVQRVLRPLVVVNPYAKEMKFPDTKLRMRRDQRKYLTLIKSIALLQQYQREKKIGKDENGERFEYIEVEKEDMELGSILASKILGRTLEELTPQTKEVLFSLYEMVEKESEEQNLSKNAVRFTRRQARERLGMSDTRLRVHLRRLEELEYLVVRSRGQGQLVEYELLYDGEGREGEEFTLGLTFLGARETGETDIHPEETVVDDGLFSWKEIFGLERKEEVREVV